MFVLYYCSRFLCMENGENCQNEKLRNIKKKKFKAPSLTSMSVVFNEAGRVGK